MSRKPEALLALRAALCAEAEALLSVRRAVLARLEIRTREEGQAQPVKAAVLADCRGEKGSTRGFPGREGRCDGSRAVRGRWGQDFGGCSSFCKSRASAGKILCY